MRISLEKKRNLETHNKVYNPREQVVIWQSNINEQRKHIEEPF